MTFTVVCCACGVERQAALRCPDCGREPEELDPNVERRRAIVRAATSHGSVDEAEPVDLAEACAALGGWFGRFSVAFEATGEDSVEDAASRLRGPLEELAVLRARVERTCRLRPDHAAWAAIAGALSALSDARDAYLDAFAAATVEEAEEAAERGQAAIDGVAAALDRFNALDDAWERVDSAGLADEDGDLLGLAGAVVEFSGVTDMIVLDREGAGLFSRITGDDDMAPPGLGLSLQLLDFVIEAAMDPTRFWPTAQDVYRLLLKHDAALRLLYADAAWRGDFAGVTVEVRDAGFEATAVAAAGANRRRLVQSFLRLAARQIERASQPLLATLLAIEGRRPYATERNRDINSLLTRAAQSGHEGLLLGLDPKLRDADAHGNFEIDEDGVRLTGARGHLDYLSDPELVDIALAGTESVIALYWGLVAALVAVGIDVEEIEELVAAGVTDTAKIQFFLLLNGWRNVDVQIDDSHLIARGERDGENKVNLISAVAFSAPPACETLTLIATNDGATRTATGPLVPFRRWRDTEDGQEKEIALTLALMAWTIDGTSILTCALTEKLYAVRAMKALNPQIPSKAALHALRRLLNASRAIGSDELATAIAVALRLRRQATVATPSTASVSDVVSAFDRWLLVDLPDMPSSW